MKLIPITRDVQIALAAWNGAITRARREYASHPIAGQRTPCDGMATHDHLCARCERTRHDAAERMRARRKENRCR